MFIFTKFSLSSNLYYLYINKNYSLNEKWLCKNSGVVHPTSPQFHSGGGEVDFPPLKSLLYRAAFPPLVNIVVK